MSADSRKNFKGLVILAEFTDRKFMRDDSNALFHDMLNKQGYTGFYNRADPPAFIEYSGSVRDYFFDNSMGLFDPVFDVVGPVSTGVEQRFPQQSARGLELLAATLDAASATVDFSRYDADGDGEVDMVYVIYAGGGSNQVGNDSEFVWPHAGRARDLAYNGVKIGNFACSTELYGRESFEAIDGIGTICHEFSHVLGLPDLYDTDYAGSGGLSVHPDGWSIMAGGTYYNYGRTPCGYSAYERYTAGFGTPELLDRTAMKSSQGLNKSNSFFRVNTADPDEFFLIENRQQNGWDRYLPGRGLLVWHVDSTDVEVWENNMVNASPGRNYLEVRRADPQTSPKTGRIIDSAFDTYPGSGKHTEARFFDHEGADSGVSLINISEERYSGQLSFVVLNDRLPSMTENFDNLLQAGEGRYQGAFTFWTLDGCTPKAAPEGKFAIEMVKGASIESGDIPEEVSTIIVDIHNTGAATAYLRCQYSTNGGLTWKNLSDISGADNSMLAYDGKTTVTYIVPGARNSRFRITLPTGSRTVPCLLDMIKLQYIAGQSSVEEITEPRRGFACTAAGDDILVSAAPGLPVEAYRLDGSRVAYAMPDATGQCRLSGIASGVLILRQGCDVVKFIK